MIGLLAAFHQLLTRAVSTLNQVRIQIFLEKTKKKTGKNKEADCKEGDAKDQEILRKRVTKLMKKQKLPQVQRILKKQEDFKPWGQDAHAKVNLSPNLSVYK